MLGVYNYAIVIDRLFTHILTRLQYIHEHNKIVVLNHFNIIFLRSRFVTAFENTTSYCIQGANHFECIIIALDFLI